MLYPDAEKYIDEILQIVEKCPESYKQKCFEVLLQGYVDYQLRMTIGEEGVPGTEKAVRQVEDSAKETQIPTEILQRFKTFAKRLDVGLEKLERLFDFTTDPFIYQPFNPPGTNAAEKVRSIALILAAKSYLATGNWNADWKEVKSLCVDHNCYSANNHLTNLQKGKGNIFKNVELGGPIILAPDGIKQAEAIIKSLTEAE
jgi:hypothetical protein